MRLLHILILGLLVCACRKTEDTHESTELKTPDTMSGLIHFTDVSKAAGIDFRHTNGAEGKKYFPEMAGAGCGFLDYNGDGLLDILLINGNNWTKNSQTGTRGLALYKNLGNGLFRETTEEAGLNVSLYGMGMVAADYDNDGDTDLLITAVGPNKFFRNDGGVFTDITEQAGVEDPAWSTSAMFFDYDKDGLLDLYVCNYVKWSEETDLWCTLDGKTKAYCTPEIYTGEPIPALS